MPTRTTTTTPALSRTENSVPVVNLGGLRRSIAHTGPLVIAFLLGAFLVTSSFLSYRDARLASRLVAERQGIAWLFRLHVMMPDKTRDSASVSKALAANESLGLAYIGLVEHGRIIAAAGEPLLPDAEPQVGSPAFGNHRVRMVSPGPGREMSASGSTNAASSPARSPGSPEVPGQPVKLEQPMGSRSEMFPLPPYVDRPFSASSPPFSPQLVVEFKPRRRRGDHAAGVRHARALVWRRAGPRGNRHDPLGHLRRAESSAQRLLVQSHLARLGEMSAVLAHEIRNPLAALKGHAQLLAERIGDGPLQLRVERVVGEALRLETLTNSLLRFAASGTIHRGPVSPGDVLGRAVAATDASRIECRQTAAPQTWDLDESRIEQVLVNLLDNALAVTPSNEKVIAEISVEEDRLIYAIRDHGPGVAPRERARIFDAFHTTKTCGTGLGLSVSKRIVDLHHGRIAVEDAAGGGALFRVVIPSSARAEPRT